MFRTAVRAIAALATVAAIAVAPAAAQAAPAPRPEPSPTATQDLRLYPPVAQPRLVNVDFARHRNFDRLVFRFRGGTPDVDYRFVRSVRLDPSGRRVFVPGRAFLLLRFDPARARDFDRSLQYTDDLRDVRGFRLVGDYEGVVTFAVGLRNRAEVNAYTLGGGRVVLDVYDSYDYRVLQ